MKHLASLKDFTDADLQAELDRRDEVSKTRPEPLPLPACEWSPVQRAVEDMASAIEMGRARNDPHAKDYAHEILGQVIHAVYGDASLFYEWERKANSVY